MDIALMIEGQDGLTWPRWQRLVRLAEDLGYAGLYRSDHFTGSRPPDEDSLEVWVSLTWLAANTRRIEFGPLVCPFSYRHPAHLARMASAVDDLSGGRLTLGLGAGWNQREHDKFGFDLLEIDGRFTRFAEGLEVVSQLLHSDQPVNFSGQFYTLREAVLLPRPARPGGPPLLIGGGGPRRTLPLAARYADEWNCTYLLPAAYAERSARLDDLLRAQGRDPASVRRSMMTGAAFARDRAAVERKSRRFADTPEKARARGVIVGGPEEVLEQLRALAAAGVQRLMFQWLDLDDTAGIEHFAQDVLPRL
jgi:F420-dependent oxidoreductase-like protein